MAYERRHLLQFLIVFSWKRRNPHSKIIHHDQCQCGEILGQIRTCKMIKLRDIIMVDDPSSYKLHLACRNTDGVSPLDEYVSDPQNWVGWNTWKEKRNDWTRDLVFSLMEFYPKQDTWLFGGIFRVLERREDQYVLEEIEQHSKYVGRLLLSFHRYQGMRGRGYFLEKYIDEFEVLEIFPARYSGERFPGFEHICHDFQELEPIFWSVRADWNAALSSVKGVYAITDKSNGRNYIGSAYGEGGIWSRWACYIGTGHGWNDALMELIAKRTIRHARGSFRFSLLETFSMNASDDTVRKRETHWKRAFMSKKFGYNEN